MVVVDDWLPGCIVSAPVRKTSVSGVMVYVCIFVVRFFFITDVALITVAVVVFYILLTIIEYMAW